MKSNYSIGIDARLMLRPLRGMPLYVLRLCQNLPVLNRDYQFIYFINKGFEHNDAPENYLPRIEEIEKNNPNVTFVNYNDEGEIKWEQIYLSRLIKQHKVDLLHMPGNRICFFPGVPTIVTVHDVIENKNWNSICLNQFFDKESSLRMAFYKLRIYAYILANYNLGFRRAAHVITVSNYSAKEIEENLKIMQTKITPICHGLDKEFEINQTTLRNNDNLILGTRKHVLMLGGDSNHKNPEGAIASWSMVPIEIRKKYPLKIIGFSGGPSSRLLAALTAYDLRGEVEVKGWVTQQVLIDHLRSAALFLFLSRYEGFGFPPLHAMASGTPVVASNCSSIPEVLGNVGYMFDPSDHIGVSKGIEALLTDSVLWKTQSDAGISRAKMFNWLNSYNMHMQVYDRGLEASI